MGAIGGLLGLGGGTNGTGQNILNGTNANQLQNSYDSNQGALQSQQQLLQALQGQNGVGNQSQVYNQLQGVVNGTGPNPAQAQLAQATGANNANQAALMAGQRGAGANVGLLARQAAMQGAANQQNAAGQAATLQANQSLNALGQAGNIANTQVGNQIGATTANTQAQQSEQGILQGANSANNSVQGQLANTTMQGQQGAIGGLTKAAGSLLPLLALSDGGQIGASAPSGQTGPQSGLGKFLSGWAGNQATAQTSLGGTNGSAALENGIGSLGAGIAKALTKPTNPQAPVQMAGEPSPLPDGAMMAARGGDVGPKLKSGGGVPGKAAVSGNSPKNDTVKALLSPGEGVIDRETMGDKGAVGDAARFVMAYVNHKKARK